MAAQVGCGDVEPEHEGLVVNISYKGRKGPFPDIVGFTIEVDCRVRELSAV
jgi:hypothetical protein